MNRQNLLVVAITFSAVVTLVFFSTLLLPGDFKVVRTLKIDATPAQLSQYTHNLATWPEWTLWSTSTDKAATFKPEGEPNTIGQKLNWTGDLAGAGYFEITNIEFEELLRYKMNITSAEQMYHGEIRFEVISPTQTKVFWTVSGNVPANPVLRVANLFADQQYGVELEHNLNGLKNVAD